MVQRKTRFSEASEESLHAVFQDLDTAIEQKGNEKPSVAPKTKAERDQIWISWTEYVLSTSF